MINEIEASIVTRLRAKIPPPIRVEAFPDSPENYPFLTPHGSVYVRFHEEDLEIHSKTQGPKSQTMGIIRQDGTFTFVVSVLHRNLRVQGGIYKLIDDIKVALRGFKPIPGSSKMWIIKTGLVGEDKGTWHYEVWVGVLMPQVEQLEPDAGLGIAHHLTFHIKGASGGVETLDIVENEADDPADETVTFTLSPNGGSRTEPMPPHQEPEEE